MDVSKTVERARQILSVHGVTQVGAPVELHFRNDGELVCRNVVLKSAYFDAYKIAVIEGSASPKPSLAPPQELDPKSVARFALYGLRNWALRAAPAVKPRRPVYDLRDYGLNNFSHVLIDALPFALLVKRHIPDVLILLSHLSGPYTSPVLDIFKFFGVDVALTRRRFEGGIVTIAGERAIAPYRVTNLIDFPGIAMFNDVYDGFEIPKSEKAPKIFLARRGPRSLLNMGEIEQILSVRGYETIYMEDYTIEQQMSICASASDIVAIHGAAMGFLALNKSIRLLVELFPPCVFHDHFALSLAHVVKRHVALVPHYDPRVSLSGWGTVQAIKNQPFSVDAAMLTRALENADAGGAG
ncbi:MAG: glycosyltransferase family 61 protein, partial [Parvularculaceae bacterium]|nr:glycosyltransferase family 61 protein [Parvularculaceae bacterium]